MGFAKRRRLKVAGHDRGVDVAVVPRIADRDGRVAGVEFDERVVLKILDPRSEFGKPAGTSKARDADRARTEYRTKHIGTAA